LSRNNKSKTNEKKGGDKPGLKRGKRGFKKPQEGGKRIREPDLKRRGKRTKEGGREASWPRGRGGSFYKNKENGQGRGDDGEKGGGGHLKIFRTFTRGGGFREGEGNWKLARNEIEKVRNCKKRPWKKVGGMETRGEGWEIQTPPAQRRKKGRTKQVQGGVMNGKLRSYKKKRV